MAVAQGTSSEITLKGSVDIVAEFFDFSINCILYQRGIYAPEDFRRQEKYGLAMFVTSNEGLSSYLENVLSQLKDWLTMGQVQRLVLVVNGVDSGDTLERWVFNIQTEHDAIAAAAGGAVASKPEKEIMKEIQALIRQITASVTFLPLLEEPCTFDLLVYTDNEAQVPTAWEESDPRHIAQGEHVKLRAFTTKVHKVDAGVTYKNVADDDDDC